MLPIILQHVDAVTMRLGADIPVTVTPLPGTTLYSVWYNLGWVACANNNIQNECRANFASFAQGVHIDLQEAKTFNYIQIGFKDRAAECGGQPTWDTKNTKPKMPNYVFASNTALDWTGINGADVFSHLQSHASLLRELTFLERTDHTLGVRTEYVGGNKEAMLFFPVNSITVQHLYIVTWDGTTENGFCTNRINLINDPAYDTTDCSAGEYDNGGTCTPCPVGQFSDAGSTSCVDTATYCQTVANPQPFYCLSGYVDNCIDQTEFANTYLSDYDQYSTFDTNQDGCIECTEMDAEYQINSHCDVLQFLQPCPADTYLDAGTCVDCPFGSVSAVGSDSVDDCQCAAGYYVAPYGDQSCEVYGGPLPYYCMTGWKDNCVDSADWDASYLSFQSMSNYDSDSNGCVTCSEYNLATYNHAANCGTIFNSLDQCQACESGKYKATIGPDACQNCPETMVSANGDGGTGSQYCVCDIGAFLMGDYCELCPIATYKDNYGNNTCLSCSGDSSKSTSTSGATGLIDCECIAGYGLESIDMYGIALCTPCQQGTFKESLDNSYCESCPFGSTTLYTQSLSQASCISAPGYYGQISNPSGFTPCPYDTYKGDAGGTDEGSCIPCFNGATTESQASTNITDCTCSMGSGYKPYGDTQCACAAGFYDNNPDPAASSCVMCEAGKYCPEDCSLYGSDQFCLARLDCPELSTSNPGSISPTQCQCQPGYVGTDSCVACEIGKYQESPQSCAACPNQTTTLAEGSASIDSCVCFAGFTVGNASESIVNRRLLQASPGSCENLPPGPPPYHCLPGWEDDCVDASEWPAVFPPFSGFDNGDGCISCVDFSIVNPTTDCDTAFNNIGQGPPQAPVPQIECVACAEGKYKDVAGNGECFSCPELKSSVAGASSIGECFCVPGYSNPLACSEESKQRSAQYPNLARSCGGGVGCPTIGTNMWNVAQHMIPSNAVNGLYDDSYVAILNENGYLRIDLEVEFLITEVTLYVWKSAWQCRNAWIDVKIASEDDVTKSRRIAFTKGKHAYGGSWPPGTITLSIDPSINSQGRYVFLQKMPLDDIKYFSQYDNPYYPQHYQDSYHGGCVVTDYHEVEIRGSSYCNCTICPVNKYESSHTCFDCPTNTDTQGLDARSSISECLCSSGFYGTIGACNICDAGNYCLGGYEQTPCPVYRNSNAGAATVDDCFCETPYVAEFGDHGDCVLCSAGKYRNDNAVCEECPSNSQSLEGSTSITSCSCEVGFEGPAGGPCSPLLSCPPGTTGAESVDLSTCVSCAAGTFKRESGDSACQSCIENTTSVSGSTECVCKSAYKLNDECGVSTIDFLPYKGGHPDGVWTWKGARPAREDPYYFVRSSYPMFVNGDVWDNFYQNVVPNVYELPECLEDGSIYPCRLPVEMPADACLQSKNWFQDWSTYRTTVGEPKFNFEGGKTMMQCNVYKEPVIIDRMRVTGWDRWASPYDIYYWDVNTFVRIVPYHTCNSQNNCPLDADGKYPLVKQYMLFWHTGTSFVGSRMSIKGTDLYPSGEAKYLPNYDFNDGKPSFEHLSKPNPSDETPSSSSKHGGFVYWVWNFAEVLPDGKFTFNKAPAQSCEFSKCSGCPANTYLHNGVCTLCNANYISPPISSNVSACECITPGFVEMDAQCVQCPAGKYSGIDACEDCPSNSNSSFGSFDITDCQCLSGFFKELDSCIGCDAGQYLFNDVCVNCPLHSSSAYASSDISDCICDSGYTAGPDNSCIACGEGYYKNVSGNHECTACPDFATSIAGSTSIFNCSCHEGYKQTAHHECGLICAKGFEHHEANVACYPCNNNYYKENEGDHACKACPANSFHSKYNSTSVDDCLCARGFLRHASWPVIQECVPCADGSFTMEPGSERCFDCFKQASKEGVSHNPSAWTYTGPDWSSTAYLNNNNEKWCHDAPSYATVDLGEFKVNYGLFLRGYKANGYTSIAKRFAFFYWYAPSDDLLPSDADMSNSNFHTAVGNGDYSISDFENSACEVTGCWKRLTTALSTGHITINPSETTSVTYLKPEFGFDCDIHGQCYEYSIIFADQSFIDFDSIRTRYWRAWTQQGTYGNQKCLTFGAIFGSGKCEKSVEHNLQECRSMCNFIDGHAITDTGVQKCGFNQFNNGTRKECFHCSEGSGHFKLGAVNESECECHPGYYRPIPGVGACQKCPINTFKNMFGNMACSTCPPNTISIEGSTTAAQCLCKRGYEYVENQCKLCDAGWHKNTVGSLNCEKNPVNSVSSPNRETYICLPGFTSQFCTPCAANTYKSEYGDSFCLPCTGNSTSPASSIDPSDCICYDSFTKKNGKCIESCSAGKMEINGVCEACPIGKYRSPNEINCTSCPSFANISAVGSKSLTDCLCAPGKIKLNRAKYAVMGNIGDYVATHTITNSPSQVNSDKRTRLKSIKFTGITEHKIIVRVSHAGGTITVFNCDPVDCVDGEYPLWDLRGTLVVFASGGHWTVDLHTQREVQNIWRWNCMNEPCVWQSFSEAEYNQLFNNEHSTDFWSELQENSIDDFREGDYIWLSPDAAGDDVCVDCPRGLVCH